MQDLPEFQKNAFQAAQKVADTALTIRDRSLVHELKEFEDGHFRAYFDQSYFTLRDGQTEPTKSQWNTLKKRFKRINPHVFIFKEHGQIDDFYYIDFGFYKNNE